jgi:DNA polymerase III subunit delta'
MTYPDYFDSKKTLNLFGLKNNFIFLKELFLKKNFPNVLMLSGKKGSGKSTLLNHLMFYIFDQKNYDINKNKLINRSPFYSQFVNNIYSNIIYLSGSDYKNTKVDDIRNLKNKIFQSSILDKPRFIIFDDIELFNNNSLNALLKIIEEPTKNNFFLIINNKTKPLIDTIKSRCLDIKLILSENHRQKIIKSLVREFNVDIDLNQNQTQLTPGFFIKLNYILKKYEISTQNEYLKNLTMLLNLYKKDKETIFIDTIKFLTDNYFIQLKNTNSFTNYQIIEYKKFVFKDINNFFLYNLNQTTLLNKLSNKIINE